MKKFLSLMMITTSMYAASMSVTIDLDKFKAGFTQPDKLHRLAYIADTFALGASLGIDGGGSEYALANSRLWVSSCGCYRPYLREQNPLFLSRSGNGDEQFSQAKFWTYKIILGTIPFVFTKINHKYLGDNKGIDALNIGIGLAATGGYTYLGVHNYKLGNEVYKLNKAAGH